MSIARKVLKMFESVMPLDADVVKRNIASYLIEKGYDFIDVVAASVDPSGDVIVHLESDGESTTWVFTYDEEEGAMVFVDPDNTDGSDEDAYYVDLNDLNPPLRETDMVTALDLEADLSWLDDDTLYAMLVDPEDDMGGEDVELDDYYGSDDDFEDDSGYYDDEEFGESLDAPQGFVPARKARKVVRDGKVIKLGPTKMRRKRKLTPKQKMALAKARRFAQTAKAIAKRKKSLAKRRMLGL